MQIVNRTPYAMERAVILDRRGHETLLVVLKGTFAFAEGRLTLAAEQAPLTITDEYHGDPQSTGVRVATDMLPRRPATGITLNGHARSLRGPVPGMPVSLRVGGLLQKAVVIGDRLGYGNVDRPQPFETMPLQWENAFGGLDTSHDKPEKHEAHPDNPVGKGFIARHSRLDPDAVPLPNLEHPEQRLRRPGDCPPVVGFAPVAPFWLPRRQFGGTYDDAWVRERAPLLPDDFDDRFLQAAPAGLVTSGYLAGDEEVEIQGMTEEGSLRFRLGAHRPTLGLRLARKGIRAEPELESVHFDTDARLVTCTWKHAFDVQGKVEEMINIEARLLQ